MTGGLQAAVLLVAGVVVLVLVIASWDTWRYGR